MRDSPTEARVWEALAGVTDPEYPLSIVDLGMVYDVAVSGDVAHVVMTFTSIGCPAIEMLVDDVREAVAGVPGIARAEVDVVWNPPWTKDRISDRGRRVLAVYGVVN
ncbi:MAG TPA: metal-sulfur cluster assembly factor [Gemmatimonadales bacterium]|nr:metal-sulfur cluster assembly factor [Gemmatimonadales bacterium]